MSDNTLTVGSLVYELLSYTSPSGIATVSQIVEADSNSLGDLQIEPSVTNTYNDRTFLVTSIAEGLFKGNTSLTSITIPNTITSIPANTFSNCTALTAVIFTPTSSVTSIGNNAFSGCGSLTSSITIPSGVTSIGEYAFSGCSAVTSITIPSSVTSIGDYAFFECLLLKSVNFTPTSSVTSIGQYAFSNCSSLTSITIPSSVESIGEYAFSGQNSYAYCVSLNSVIFTTPSSVNSIGNAAFAGCRSLTSITIPSKVTTLSSNLFYHNPPDAEDVITCPLTSLTIDGIITSFEEYALWNIESPSTLSPTLEYLTFNGTVTASTPAPTFGYDWIFGSLNYGATIQMPGPLSYPYCSQILQQIEIAYTQAYYYEWSSFIIKYFLEIDLFMYNINTSDSTAEVVLYDSVPDQYSATVFETVDNYIVNSIGAGAFASSQLETINIQPIITNFGYQAFYNGSSNDVLIECLSFDAAGPYTGVPTGIISTGGTYIDNNRIFVNSLNTTPPHTATIQVPGPSPFDGALPLYSTSIVEAINNDYPGVTFNINYILQTTSNNVQYVTS